VREIRMLRLTWQGIETWLQRRRHSLTLPVTDAGAEVRSTLTTVAATIKKRGGEVKNRVKLPLDLLVRNPPADPYAALFPSYNPP
jgi:hypothetical protein